MIRFNWPGAVLRAGWRALHWRALLLWWASLSLVALVAAIPIYGLLDAQLSHAIDAPRYAHAMDLLVLGDLANAAARDAAPRTGVMAALGFTVLLWPWLTGVMVAAVRLGRGARLFVLAAEGMREYGRQLRLMLWSVLPLAPCVALGVWLLHGAGERASHAILLSDAQWMRRGAMAGAVLLFLLAYVLTELARARMAARDDTRSVLVVWWRALKIYWRRPIALWGVSLLMGIVGALVLAGLGQLRIHASGAGWGHFAVALLLTQCLTLAMGWLRLARLHALAQLVDNDAARRAVQLSGSAPRA